MHSCTAVKFRCDVNPCSNNILQLDSFVLCDIGVKKCFTVPTRTIKTTCSFNSLHYPLKPRETHMYIFIWVTVRFIYNFWSSFSFTSFILEWLVESIFWNPVELFVFKSVHNHFKLFWYGVLIKIRGVFWRTAKRQFKLPF